MLLLLIESGVFEEEDDDDFDDEKEEVIKKSDDAAEEEDEEKTNAYDGKPAFETASPAEWKTAAPAEWKTANLLRGGARAKPGDLPDLAREPKANVQVSERVEQEFRGFAEARQWYEQMGGI